MIATATFAAALFLEEQGISVVPVRSDGSKAPAGRTWKEYQDRRATPDELVTWFGPPTPRHHAIGIITGGISGNLEMLEIEGRAAHELNALQDLAIASGFGDLWARVCNGWLELSPSGGYHWFYRVADQAVSGNTKLASRPSTPEELAENPREKRKVLAETRGAGGFVVTAPSNGTTHETGRPWTVVAGGPDTVPTITAAEQQQLHILMMSLNVEDDEPAPSIFDTPTSSPNTSMFGEVSPGDDYEAKVSWPEILTPSGWKIAAVVGRTTYWTRPGKKAGVSATTGHDPARDRLWVFSSSTDFDQQVPYTKFGAYSHLEHAGNHSAAASALRKAGYGKEPMITTGGPPSATGSQPAPAATTPAPSATAPAAPATIAAATGAIPGQPSPSEPAATEEQHPTFEGNLATVTELRPRTLETIAHTDDGNAALFIHEHGWEVRYNADRGRWLHWTGAIWDWQPAGGGVARELAKDTVRGIEVLHDTTRTWKKKSLSASGITNLLLQAQTDQRITVATEDLDAHPWDLNTPGGIVDLRTGQLRPADPTRLHTKQTAITPDFGADRSVWLQFLADTMPDNQAMIDYLQRLAGYSSVGLVREHILPFGLGSGGNGKGVLFETLTAVLGDYATSAPAGFLMKTGFQTHPTDLARLQGARLVICSEVNPEDKFDEAKMKQLAGGDSITARFMRTDFFTFKPTHQLWLMGNFQPGVEAGGRAFWRRLRLIPFTHEVPEEKVNVNLPALLAGEHGPAVLAWVAEGAALYHQGGLAEPEQVKTATTAYAHDVDTVARFLEDECTKTPALGGTTPLVGVNALRNAYERYCEGNADKPLKGRAFAMQLGQHGIKTGRDVEKGPNGQRQYAGVRLLSSTYRPADDEPPAEPDPQLGDDWQSRFNNR